MHKQHALNACPFCASEGAQIEVVTHKGMLGEYPEPDRTFVVCECGCRGPVVESPHVRDEKVLESIVHAAIARWNLRR